LSRIYLDWCSDQDPPVEPFTAPIHQVANFLAWVQKDRDLGQAAVGTFRSAISKIHVGFDGLPVGKTAVIANLVKGVGNLDPSRKARKPRYHSTWDIAPVLEALAELDPPESLSLMDLSIKTLALTALSTISRASTLAIMSRRFAMDDNAMEDDQPQLFVHFLPGKQEKTGRFRNGLFVSELSDEPSLDPTTYLLHYRRRTNALLSGTPEDLLDRPLWVSSKKPHLPVSSVTLATWLGKAMARGGIDTEVFKPHSVRLAVPAHLRRAKALSLAQILARGGWKPSADGRSSVFLKFYDRNIV